MNAICKPEFVKSEVFAAIQIPHSACHIQIEVVGYMTTSLDRPTDLLVLASCQVLILLLIMPERCWWQAADEV